MNLSRILLGAFGLIPGLFANTEQAAKPLPNVLLIAIDDLNSNLGCLGHPLVRSPHMDAFARRGTSFSRAYCQYPLCNPSRASMLTGLRPDQIRIYDLPTHFRHTEPDVVTLPQFFRRRGYATGRVGKIFHAGVPQHIGLDGLDDPASWEFRSNPRGRDKDEEDKLINLTPQRGPGAAVRWLAADGTDEEQTDGKVATEAIRMLGRLRNGGRPFFLGVGFYRPHVPFVAPKRYFELYPLENIPTPPDPTEELKQVPPGALYTQPPFWGLPPEKQREAIRAYYASISFVDAQVGRVLDEVDRLGLAENTVIVLWSDHGYLLGEHGQFMKESLFEAAVRAPLIISAPSFPPTLACERIVEFLDIYPTVVELAGQPRPSALAGRSLVPLMKNPSADWPYAAFSQTYTNFASGRSIRTERWRYSEWGEDGREGRQLYDESEDPGERSNLAGRSEYAAIENDLRQQLGAAVRVPPKPAAKAKE